MAQSPAQATNIPLPAAELVDRLQNDAFSIARVEGAEGGVMGAKKLRIVFRDDDFSIDVKWKAAPAGGEGWNNSPRREIAAYAVQQLFLDPSDYPIPPVVGRAISLQDYRVIEENPAPTLAGSLCVFGAMAAWLENVYCPARAFDSELLARDNVYAFHFANLNILAYLIAHRDARSSNFLMSCDPTNSRVFLVDNGIAFGGVLYNFFTWHFDKIRTAGLPRQSIDRLRRISREQLTSLGILGQWEMGEDGVLRPVKPHANFNPNVGTRVMPGRIQLGLTIDEIDAMATRLTDLLARVDAGELAVL